MRPLSVFISFLRSLRLDFFLGLRLARPPHVFTRQLSSAQKALLLPRRIFYLHPSHHRVPRYFRPSALLLLISSNLTGFEINILFDFLLYFFSLLLIFFIVFIVVYGVSQRVLDVIDCAANPPS